MKVLLLRDQKIMHRAGEIVEVSLAEFNHLVSIHSAEPVEEEREKPKRTSRKKG